MLVTMMAWLCCVPIVAVIVTARTLVWRPVQNNSVKHQRSTNRVHAAVAEAYASRPCRAVTSTWAFQLRTLSLSAVAVWLRRHFRHFVAAHAGLGGQTALHSSHDHCCCDVDAPC